MTEKCPECNSDLIKLYSEKECVSTDSFQSTYSLYSYYGYWCKFCEKMYETHHKSWLEPWKYQSCKESAKKENNE